MLKIWRTLWNEFTTEIRGWINDIREYRSRMRQEFEDALDQTPSAHTNGHAETPARKAAKAR